MKKRIALLLAVLMVCALVVGCSNASTPAANANASSSAKVNESAGGTATSSSKAGSDAFADLEPITLVLGHTNAETDPRQTMVEKFAKVVEEKTGGKLTIKIYASGELGNGKEEIEGLGMGTQDILVEGYAIMAMYSKQCMDSLPYLYRDYDHFMNCWYNSEVGDMWTKYASDAGYTVFGASYRGFRDVTSMKTFTKAEEVAGLKIRVPSSEPFVSTWTSLKAQATPMDLSEVITGLQQGTIQAQENPVLLSYNSGFCDVCKYLILTQHSCGADVFIMDNKHFSKLPEAYQTVIKETAAECSKEISISNKALEQEYIQKFADKGVEIIKPDMESFRKAYAGFVDKYFPQMADIADKIAAVK